MYDKINERLKWISENLAEGSANYVADFRLYFLAEVGGGNVQEIISLVLGHPVVIGGSQSSSSQAVIQSLREGLDCKGDYASHPGLAFLASDEFAEARENILKCVSTLCSSADLILLFWIKEGHPFYPVYWDFAYLIQKGPEAYVFIGSSSD